MINNATINPYDPISYKKKKIKIINENSECKKDLVSYKFGFEITGSNTDRLLLLSTGYKDSNEEDNYFILDDNDIQSLIEQLSIERERILKSKKAKEDIKVLHDELNEYLKKGYVESITIEYKPHSLPPYYSSALYKAFIIKPNFKYEIPTDINTGFNFLEVFHMSLNEAEFDKTMNYIRNYHDIPIHIIGYDRDAEIEKRKKEALKRMDELPERNVNPLGSGSTYTNDEIAKYSKLLKEMNIPINVLNKSKK